MTGSIKQIEWAEKIKAAYVGKLNQVIVNNQFRATLEGSMGADLLSAIKATVAKSLAQVETMTDAKVWIDNRANLEAISEAKIVSLAQKSMQVVA